MSDEKLVEANKAAFFRLNMLRSHGYNSTDLVLAITDAFTGILTDIGNLNERLKKMEEAHLSAENRILDLITKALMPVPDVSDDLMPIETFRKIKNWLNKARDAFTPDIGVGEKPACLSGTGEEE